jgi:DNA invertase Pin-like site-specific DNA recombinase
MYAMNSFCSFDMLKERDRTPMNQSIADEMISTNKGESPMKKSRHSTEQIIRILREGDAGGRTKDICRLHNISAQTFYRWKKKYGTMG